MAAGSAVTITGKNFTNASSVKFYNGVSAGVTVVSDTEITTTVPAGANTGPITITTPGGSAQSTANFSVTSTPAAPTITSFSPTSGVAGTSVVIVGSGFGGVTAVDFGTGYPASFAADNSTQITASVPLGTPTGACNLTVVASGGLATSATSFTVSASPAPPTDVPAWWGTGISHTASSTVSFSGVSQGDTVVLGAGTYTLSGSIPSGVRLLGVSSGGVIKTIVNSTVQWGNGCYVDSIWFRGSGHHPASGGSQPGAGSSTYGAVFHLCRFRSSTYATLDLASNCTNSWASAVLKNHMVANVFYDCEFEKPGVTNTDGGGIFNMWWDVRPGGAQMHNLSFVRCHFGCTPASGGAGLGRCVLFQTSPSAGNGMDGPTPQGGSICTTSNINRSFDWSQVDHCCHDISFTDCLFEAPISNSNIGKGDVAFDICDIARQFATWKAIVTGDSAYANASMNAPGSYWNNPAKFNVPVLNYGFTFSRCYDKGGSNIGEIGKNSSSINSNFSCFQNGQFGNTSSGSFSASAFNGGGGGTGIFPSGASNWSGSYSSPNG